MSDRGAIIIAIPAICLVVTLVAWIWSRQAVLEQSQQIEQREAVIARSHSLLMTLLDAETGVRGYNISYNKKFLQPYQKARASLPTSLNRLEELVLDNPSQYQQMQRIKQLARQRIDILVQRIELIEKQRQTGIKSPQLVNTLNEGKEVMDAIRASLANLEAEEQNQLNFQQQHYQWVENVTTTMQWTSALASVIAYLAAVFLFGKLDRELHERELQVVESKNFVEAITTNIVDGVVTLTEAGDIETVNPAATKMFGYASSEIIGKNFARLLVDPATDAAHKQKQIQELTDRLMHLDRLWQTTGYSKASEPFPIEISVSKMNLDDRWIVIIRNLSERQEAETALRAKAEELAYLSTVLTKTNLALQKQNQELDKFAYVASHDLKAPLRAIASLSEWIEEDLQGKLSEEGQRMMQLLRGRVYRLEALMNGLLEYSRIGRIPATIETVDVEELLREVIAFLMPPPSFKIEIAPGMPTLKTKKRLLQEVFLNLIDNAIKHHHRPDGQIKISVADRGDCYEFAVADDGPGIAPEYHDKVFAIFQTLHARDVMENTGIGLSLVKKILDIEGGTIWLESQAGAGATFYFTWLKSNN